MNSLCSLFWKAKKTALCGLSNMVTLLFVFFLLSVLFSFWLSCLLFSLLHCCVRPKLRLMWNFPLFRFRTHFSEITTNLCSSWCNNIREVCCKYCQMLLLLIDQCVYYIHAKNEILSLQTYKNLILIHSCSNLHLETGLFRNTKHAIKCIYWVNIYCEII